MADSLFDAPPPSGEMGVTPETEPEVSPENGEVAAPAGVSLLEVQALLEPIQTQLATAQSQNSDLQAEIARLQSSPAPAQTADGFIDDFTNDAMGTVKGLSEKVSQDQIAKLMPFLEQTNNGAHQMLSQAQETIVDGRFGPGTWKDVIEPVFVARMNDLRKTNAMALSNPEIIKQEVNSIMGFKLDELMTRKTDSAAAATTAAETQFEELRAKLNLTGMTGGNSVPQPTASREPTDAEKDYLASKAISGDTADIKTLRASAARGGSLAEWQKAQEAQS